jgi:serine/threonine protein kinase
LKSKRNVYVFNGIVKLTEIEFSETVKHKVKNLTAEDIYQVSYMSPEILTGEYDFKTDIWYYFIDLKQESKFKNEFLFYFSSRSFGCIMFELYKCVIYLELQLNL